MAFGKEREPQAEIGHPRRDRIFLQIGACAAAAASLGGLAFWVRADDEPDRSELEKKALAEAAALSQEVLDLSNPDLTKVVAPGEYAVEALLPVDPPPGQLLPLPDHYRLVAEMKEDDGVFDPARTSLLFLVQRSQSDDLRGSMAWSRGEDGAWEITQQIGPDESCTWDTDKLDFRELDVIVGASQDMIWHAEQGKPLKRLPNLGIPCSKE